jgi:hypothetical protein
MAQCRTLQTIRENPAPLPYWQQAPANVIELVPARARGARQPDFRRQGAETAW